MKVKLPLGTDDQTDIPLAYANNESFDGGFHPVGENNMWHGGVHLQTSNPIYPLADGEVIALRITDDYVTDPAPKSIPIEEVTNSNINKKKVYEEYYELDNDKPGFYTIKNNSRKNRIEVNTELGNVFSNNFAIIKHSYNMLKGQPISFYSLYLHLLPNLKHIEDEHEDPFYKIREYKVLSDEAGSGKLIEGYYGNNLGIALINSIVEECPYDYNDGVPNWNWLHEKLTSDKGIHVKSYCLEKGDDFVTGFMNYNEEDLESIFQRTCKLSSNLEFYRESNKSLRGKIKKTTMNPTKDDKGFVEIEILPSDNLPGSHWTKKDEKKFTKIKIPTSTHYIQTHVGTGYLKKENLELVYKDDDAGTYNMWNTVTKDCGVYKKNDGTEFLFKLDKYDMVKAHLNTHNEETGYIKIEYHHYRNYTHDLPNGKPEENRGYVIGYVESEKIQILGAKYKIINNKGKGKTKSTGIPVYGSDSDNASVVGIIEKNKKILLSRGSRITDEIKYLQISSESEKYKNLFIKGNTGILEEEILFRKKDIKLDKVIKLKEPIPITTNDLLGYAGNDENSVDNKVYHLELFTDNVDFMDNTAKNGSDTYTINEGATNFKKKHKVLEEIQIGSVLKKESSGNPTREVSYIAGPKDLFWIKTDSLNKDNLYEGVYKFPPNENDDNGANLSCYKAFANDSNTPAGNQKEITIEKDQSITLTLKGSIKDFSLVLVDDTLYWAETSTLPSDINNTAKVYKNPTETKYTVYETFGVEVTESVYNNDPILLRGSHDYNNKKHNLIEPLRSGDILWTEEVNLKGWINGNVYISDTNEVIKGHTQKPDEDGSSNGEQKDVKLLQNDIVEILTVSGDFCKAKLHIDVKEKKGFIFSLRREKREWHSLQQSYKTLNENINLYEKDPNTTFFNDDLKKVDSDDLFSVSETTLYNNTVHKKTYANKVWLGFQLEGANDSIGWIEKKKLNSNKIDEKNLFTWTDYFEKLEDNNDIFIDLNNIISDVDVNNGNGTLEPKEVFNALKPKSDGEPNIVAEKLRKLVVKHPSEWSKDTYNGDVQKILHTNELLTESDFDEIKENLEENLLFWDKISTLPSYNNLWFFNPIKFIEHLKKMMSYNPYKGKTISVTCNGSTRTDSNIQDNPGFGPFVEGNWYLAYTNGYTKISGLFRSDYTYLHEGVDFYGKQDYSTEIKSFINGEVVAKGDQGNLHYGKYLIVKNVVDKEENLSYFYLLGHLNKYEEGISVGSTITPGQTVGYVGNTGNCYTGSPSHKISADERAAGKGTHLHLSFLKVEELGIIHNSNTSSPINIFANSYNPFKHDEKRL